MLLLEGLFAILKSMNFSVRFAGFFAAIFFTLSARAELLQKLLAKYSKATSLSFEITKIEEKPALGIKKQDSGILKYQKGKIYLLQSGEQKTEFYYAGGVLTLVSYPDSDFADSAKTKVTVLKKNIPPLVRSLLNLFSSPKQFAKDFKSTSEKSEDKTTVVVLKPQNKQAAKDVQDLTIKINSEDASLQQMSFVDEIGNKTTLSFSHIKLNGKMQAEDFKYKIKSSDEVLYE